MECGGSCGNHAYLAERDRRDQEMQEMSNAIEAC